MIAEVFFCEEVPTQEGGTMSYRTTEIVHYSTDEYIQKALMIHKMAGTLIGYKLYNINTLSEFSQLCEPGKIMIKEQFVTESWFQREATSSGRSAWSSPRR